MGFHWPPEIERMRQQSNLEWDYRLPAQSNVVALPLGAARKPAKTTEATRVYPGRANIIPLDEEMRQRRIRIEVDAAVGTKLRLDGQEYVAVQIGASPSGKAVVYWESRCAECGDAMEVFAAVTPLSDPRQTRNSRANRR